MNRRLRIFALNLLASVYVAGWMVVLAFFHPGVRDCPKPKGPEPDADDDLPPDMVAELERVNLWDRKRWRAEA